MIKDVLGHIMKDIKPREAEHRLRKDTFDTIMHVRMPISTAVQKADGA
jgi:hypothetical protein